MGFAHELAVALVVAAARGVLPIDLFQHHLVGLRAVENHGGALAPGFGGLQYAPRRCERQEMAHVRVALLGADHRAVIHDHRQGRGNLLRHGQGEIVAAAGYQSDFDAAARGFGDGFTVRGGDFPAAVEQRAINIESDQSNCHDSSAPDAGGERSNEGEPLWIVPADPPDYRQAERKVQTSSFTMRASPPLEYNSIS